MRSLPRRLVSHKEKYEKNAQIQKKARHRLHSACTTLQTSKENVLIFLALLASDAFSHVIVAITEKVRTNVCCFRYCRNTQRNRWEAKREKESVDIAAVTILVFHFIESTFYLLYFSCVGHAQIDANTSTHSTISIQVCVNEKRQTNKVEKQKQVSIIGNVQCDRKREREKNE